VGRWGEEKEDEEEEAGRRMKKKEEKKKKKEEEKIDAWMYNIADQTGGEVEGGREKKRLHTVSVPVDQDHVCCEKEKEDQCNNTHHFEQDQTFST
jgi:hypothetical protein